MKPIHLLTIPAAALTLAAAPAAAEPIDPGVVLSTMRSSLTSKGPLAERVRVTIKAPGRPARADEYLLRIDPGKRPDRSDAAIWMELGDLRVYAAGGELIAAHTADLTSCYAVSFATPMAPDTLSKLLPPVPAPLIALVLGDARGETPNISNWLTPYTPRITWTGADVAGAAGSEVVTLTGVRDAFPGETVHAADTRVTMTVDAATSRPTRLVAGLPDTAELRLDFTQTVPGNPATWPIRTANRTRVASLTDLHERRGDAAAASVMPELSLVDADWNAWEYRSVFAPAAGPAPTHLALIFVRETSADAFGAPSADAKAAQEELAALSRELRAPGAPSPAPTVRTVAVPVMTKLDDTSLRKVETARKVLANTPGREGDPLIWASSVEGTIDRFAPGSAAVCVVIRADNSLAGIVVLDARARDRDGLRADLREALTSSPAPAPAPPARE